MDKITCWLQWSNNFCIFPVDYILGSNRAVTSFRLILIKEANGQER